MITTQEIARRVGLSRPAVSSVLNGRWKQLRISPETRDRILRAAAELDYRPNHLARGLRTSKTGTIGMVIRAFDDPLQSALNERIVRLLKAQQFEALTSFVPELTDTRDIQNLYYGHRPEAIILGPLYRAAADSFLTKLARQGFPLVGFEGDLEMPLARSRRTERPPTRWPLSTWRRWATGELGSCRRHRTRRGPP